MAFGMALLVTAKGAGVPFSGGGPLSFWPQPLPGYDVLPGRGLFAYGRYACPSSVRRAGRAPQRRRWLGSEPGDAQPTFARANAGRGAPKLAAAPGDPDALRLMLCAAPAAPAASQGL